MKNVLRIGGEEITHVHYATINGVGQYLTKEDHNKMLGFSESEVEQYYSGEDHDEVNSLKEDVSDLLSGDISMEQLRLRIALSNGTIDQRNVLEVNGE